MIRFSHYAQRYLSSAIAYHPVNGISIVRDLQQFSPTSNGSISVEKFVKIHASEYNMCGTFEKLPTKAESATTRTKYDLCRALNACAKTLNGPLGLQYHAQIIQNGYEDNIILSSVLIDFYSKCNGVEDARRIFNGMKQHDQVSWSSIISSYAQCGYGVEAFLLFKNMLTTNIKPNCFTYVSIITACSRLEQPLEPGSAVHAHVYKLGLVTNVYLVSSLIDFYSKCRRVDASASLFEAATTKDSILYNSMIASYCHNTCHEDALKLLIQMREECVDPTDFTISSILNACGSLSLLCLGRQVHCLVIKQGSSTNVFVSSSLVDMYSKSGSIDEARSVFDQTVDRNSVLWTSMISGYAQTGRAIEGLALFDHMVHNGCLPDHICFTAVFSACNHAGLLNRAVEYFDRMTKDYGLIPELDHYACLVDLHARKGDLRKAVQLIDEMPFDPNFVMLSSLLRCCKTYGALDLGRKVTDCLFHLQPENAAAYLTMAHIYAEAGLWDEVTDIKKMMKQKRIKKSAAWSWVEVDGQVHVFRVGDTLHPKSHHVYVLLEQLNLETKDVQLIRLESESYGALL